VANFESRPCNEEFMNVQSSEDQEHVAKLHLGRPIVSSKVIGSSIQNGKRYEHDHLEEESKKEVCVVAGQCWSRNYESLEAVVSLNSSAPKSRRTFLDKHALCKRKGSPLVCPGLHETGISSCKLRKVHLSNLSRNQLEQVSSSAESLQKSVKNTSSHSFVMPLTEPYMETDFAGQSRLAVNLIQ
jgi:hypothetical protein